eukprot:UC4_evm2s599
MYTKVVFHECKIRIRSLPFPSCFVLPYLTSSMAKNRRSLDGHKDDIPYFISLTSLLPQASGLWFSLCFLLILIEEISGKPPVNDKLQNLPPCDTDDPAWCDGFKNNGWCESSGSYCKMECGLCVDPKDLLATTTRPISPTNRPTASTSILCPDAVDKIDVDDCEDEQSESCRYARTTGCVSSGQKISCPKTCGTCHLRDLKVQNVTHNCNDEHESSHNSLAGCYSCAAKTYCNRKTMEGFQDMDDCMSCPELVNYKPELKENAFKAFKEGWKRVSDRIRDWSPQCFCQRQMECHGMRTENRSCDTEISFDWEVLVHCQDLNRDGTMPNFRGLVINTLYLRGSTDFRPGIFNGSEIRRMNIVDNEPLSALKREDLEGITISEQIHIKGNKNLVSMPIGKLDFGGATPTVSMKNNGIKCKFSQELGFHDCN